MASRIILDPETLLAQAGEMQNLTAEYEALFSKVTGTLNDTNNHWSELLAHNFAGKISSAQQSFASITELLSSGAVAAKNSATTMQSVDQSLFKVFGGEAGEGISSGHVQGVIDVIEDYRKAEKTLSKEMSGKTKLGDSFADAWAGVSGEYENLPTWVKLMIKGVDKQTEKILKRFSKLGKVAKKIEEGKFNWRDDGGELVGVFDFSDGSMYKEIYNVIYGTKAKGTQIIKDTEDAYSAEINRYLKKGDYLNATGSLGKCLAISAYGEIYNVFDVGTGMIGNVVEKAVSTVADSIVAGGELSKLLFGKNIVSDAALVVGNGINWFGKKSNEGWHSMF